MPTPLDIAWLIPVIPFTASICIAFLLISFTKTMNRLSKPVAALSIGSMGASAILSYLLFAQESKTQQIKESMFNWHSSLGGIDLQFGILIDKSSAIFLSLISSIIIIGMIFLHSKMYRKKIYVL